MSKLNSVVPNRLDLESKFKFKCHKSIKCFTHCCSNIDILLTPYDVVRLKKRLNLESGEFLAKYAHMKVEDKSSHPYAILRMKTDEKRSCPFVTDDGCSVYTDRPANCRYYPIGQGTIKVDSNDGPVDEEFYFIVKEDHCYGFDEKKEWTIQSWREDQEVDKYDEVNREWKSVQLRKNLPGQVEMDPKKQAQFWLASYDLDGFRRFIFDSKFLEVFVLDSETVDKLKTDDIELIQFGAKYIKYIMMMENTLKVREEVLNKEEKQEGSE